MAGAQLAQLGNPPPHSTWQACCAACIPCVPCPCPPPSTQPAAKVQQLGALDMLDPGEAAPCELALQQDSQPRAHLTFKAALLGQSSLICLLGGAWLQNGEHAAPSA